MNRIQLLLPFLAMQTLLLLGCPGSSGTGGGGTDSDAGSGSEGCSTACCIDDIELLDPPAAPVTENGDPIDLSCLTSPRTVGPSQTIKAQGCIDIFGIGSKCIPGMKLAVFGRDQNPQNDVPMYGISDIAVGSQAGPFQDLARACGSDGYYEIENIPTHTPLIFAVYETESGPQQRAIPTYSFDTLLYNDDIEDGAVTHEANLVYKSTYDSIPTLGGKLVEGQTNIYDGLGRSVIAGEIRDCEDAFIKNAVVSSSQMDSNTQVSYFNGDEDPKPDLLLSATNDDGLYVILNAATDEGVNAHSIVVGVMDTDCSGDDCMCVAYGTSNITTFPDSVSILSFKGTLPVIDPDFTGDGDGGSPVADGGDNDGDGDGDAGTPDAG